MIVVYPYVRVSDAALGALREQSDPVAVYVGGSDFDYRWLLGGLWERAEPVLVVEQDVVVPPGAVAAMIACGEPWCSHPLPRHRPPHEPMLAHLGCTRFSPAIMRAVPDAFERADRVCLGLPAGHWRHLDVTLVDVLGRAGFSPHQHLPPAVHLGWDGEGYRWPEMAGG